MFVQVGLVFLDRKRIFLRVAFVFEVDQGMAEVVVHKDLLTGSVHKVSI